MSEQRMIVQKSIMMAALMLGVVALPFSITVCHIAIIAFLIFWLSEGNWRRKFSIVSSSLLIQLLLILFLWQVVGLAFSDDLATGWFSIEKKIFFLLLPLALATTSIKLARNDVRLIMAGFLAACLVGTIICLYSAWEEARLVMAGHAAVNPYLSTSSYFELHSTDSSRWLLFSYVSLAKGIDIHPTYFSLYLAFCIVFLINEFPSITSTVKKAGVLALVLYLAMFIVFLSSRVIILGLAIIFLFVLIRCALKKQRLFGAVAIGTGIIYTSLLFLNPVTQYRGLEEINTHTFQIESGKNYTNAAHIRVSLWWLAIESLRHVNPLIGEGTDDVKEIMTATSRQFQITNVINSFDPHNEYLYALIANGLPALLLLFLCLALPAWWAWLQKDFLLLGFTFLFSLVCMTESALELQKGIVFYALISGLLFFQLHSFQNISIKFRSLQRVG